MKRVAILLLFWPVSWTWAAPSVSLGKVSASAGSLVAIPIDFNAGGSSVASLQFDLVLPEGLSAGSVLPGSSLSGASKTAVSHINGKRWTFILYGLNQNLIASGPLMTLKLPVASGTLNGALPVMVSNLVFSDATGHAVAGSGSSGLVTVAATVPLTSTPSSSTRVYPNPWRHDQHEDKPYITFDHVPAGSTVKIFTVSGHLVKSLEATGDVLRWDLTIASGNRAASGLYLYVISPPDNGEPERGKLAIIR